MPPASRCRGALELKPDFLARVDRVVLWDERPLPTELKAEVQRDWERLQVVEQQIATLERTQRERVATAPVGSPLEFVQRLSQLGGSVSPARGFM